MNKYVPWDIRVLRAGKLVVLDGCCEVADALEVPCVQVVRRLLVDSILHLGHVEGPLPLAASLVQLVEQIMTSALAVQLGGIREQAQLNCYRRNLGGFLGVLISCLAKRSHTADMAHVAEAHGCNIQSAALDAHVGHATPYRRRIDAPHSSEGSVGAPLRQLVRKLQQCLTRAWVGTIEANKVTQRRSIHLGIQGDEEQPGCAQTQQGLVRRLQRNRVLGQDAIIRSGKERRNLHAAGSARCAGTDRIR